MIKGNFDEMVGMTSRLGGTENEFYLMTIRTDLDSIDKEPYPDAPLVILSEFEYDEMHDRSHSVEELYEFRMVYNAMVANLMSRVTVKSWRHSNGELCFDGGWFVVVMTLPTGQVSNHYRADYWDLFHCREVDTPPKYDGHTPTDTLQRMKNYLRGFGS